MELRDKLIRLAYEQPQLREDLLPLLKGAGEFTEQEWKTHKQKHPNADKKDHTITKGDGGGSDGSSTSKKTNIFKKVDKMKKDLESFAEDNDIDLDFDDIMYLEEEWEDALHDLKDEDEDKAEEFEEMMNEFLKQNEKKMEIADKFESMAEDLEEDKSAKDNIYVLQMIDEGGAGSDPSKHYEVLKGALDWMKDPSKSNRKNITDEQIAKNRQYGHSADKPGGLKKEERIKILERYVGELEKVMSGKKASLRDSLIRLAYEQPQLREDILPLVTKSSGRVWNRRHFYDKWKLWNDLLPHHLQAEIETNPDLPGTTELNVFRSRHKQYHNVDTLMGDMEAGITYDSNGELFTVHVGNRHSQFSVGDEKSALSLLVRYFK